MKRRRKWLWIVISLALLLAAGIWAGKNRLHVSRYDVSVPELDPVLDGLRVVQLSDLHSRFFGQDQGRLVRKAEGLSPDIILCTGDMVDSRRYREEPVLALVEKLVGIAPVYMVSGNHEWWTAGRYDEMIPRLEDLGAVVLENEDACLLRGDTTLRIIGATDPDSLKAKTYYDGLGDTVKPGEPLHEAIGGEASRGDYMGSVLPALLGEPREPALLLSHRPEYFGQYVQYGADVVFSGHAHGGQIRLPFVGGLIAPGQGIFPQYDGGLYREGDTSMVVSRGLGNSVFPVRVFNPPDVVLAVLRAE
jgi:predicted MPP superfamily phosphohydrolase